MFFVDLPGPFGLRKVRDKFDHGESVGDQVRARIDPRMKAKRINKIGERLRMFDAKRVAVCPRLNFELLDGKFFLYKLI